MEKQPLISAWRWFRNNVKYLQTNKDGVVCLEN